MNELFAISRFDCDELDLVSSKIVNQRVPEFVIGYYEEKLGWNRVRPGARVPRDLPELPDVPEPPPVVNPVIRNIKKDISAAEIDVSFSNKKFSFRTGPSASGLKLSYFHVWSLFLCFILTALIFFQDSIEAEVAQLVGHIEEPEKAVEDFTPIVAKTESIGDTSLPIETSMDTSIDTTMNTSIDTTIDTTLNATDAMDATSTDISMMDQSMAESI